MDTVRKPVHNFKEALMIGKRIDLASMFFLLTFFTLWTLIMLGGGRDLISAYVGVGRDAAELIGFSASLVFGFLAGFSAKRFIKVSQPTEQDTHR